MPNTYSQLYVQIIFTVKGRQNLIARQQRENLHKYLTGIVQNRGHKMLAVFCMPDHTHLLIGLKPTVAISDLTRDIKAGSSNFINESKWVKGKFNWQEGYGAFSYSRSQIDKVIKSILNQEKHHKQISFKDEYTSYLKKFEIEYDQKYLFEWIDYTMRCQCTKLSLNKSPKTGRSYGAKFFYKMFATNRTLLRSWLSSNNILLIFFIVIFSTNRLLLRSWLLLE